MSKLFTSTILIIFTLICMASPIFAVEEAGQAATLALHNVNAKTDTRVEHLRTFLRSYNSPLADEADVFVGEADTYNLDWKLVAAIAGVESTFGKHIPPGSYNGWGWGIPTGAQSGIGFESWEDGITTVSEGLRKNYIDRGAHTIEQMGRIYAASPRWAGSVRFFVDKIESFLPTNPDSLVVSI